MFDTPYPLPSKETRQAASCPAELFVNGEHTAADAMTRQIILQLLEEIGVVENATVYLTADANGRAINKRTAEKIEKLVCFMASFLRAALNATWFGILMNRNRWTGTPCGYQAARTITRALLDHGYILKVINPRKGQSTVFRCSEAFRERLTGLWGLLSFKRARPHPVEVREPKRDYRGSFKKKRLPLDQFPPREVRRHQATVLGLNDHLSRHPLADIGGKPLDVTLRRIFTGNLQSGGRLYADYQTLPEQDRLRCTIDGEPVCEIDLKASHVAILAALYQHPERLPRDPYAAIEWVDSPHLRKAAKTLVQCVIHADDGRPAKFPRQDNGVPFRVKYGLNDKKVCDLLPGIFKVMPFLEGSPCLTLALQFIEAEILIDALRCCQARDIPAFPIHDSLLVKQSDAVEVIGILQDKLTLHLGPHAPWLDLSVAGQSPRLIKPPFCPMDAEYHLQHELENRLDGSVEYEEQAEVIDPADDGDF